jgi:hypothetical protein
MLRRMQREDFELCIKIAQEKYARQYPRLNREYTLEALEDMVDAPGFLLLRGEYVFSAASVTSNFMEPLPVVGLLWVFTATVAPLEFLAVIKQTEEWARSLNAVEIGFGNISDRDFSKVANRLGYYTSAQYFSKSLIRKEHSGDALFR